MTETRELADGKAWLLARLERGVHPLDGMEPEAARRTIEQLKGLEPEPSTRAWGELSDHYAGAAQGAERTADERDALMQAYRAAFMGRYPTPNHPLKERMYDRARQLFIAAAQLEDPPLEVVTVPFAGRPGEGDHVTFYVTRPATGAAKPPVVMIWAGIDTWKEEMHGRLGAFLRARGYAVLLVDMPGAGESPVQAGPDAERQWTPIFDWLATREDLDAERCAAAGGSFGGYWAMKLAYTHRERLRCAVNWGGGVHVTFTPEWQQRSRNSSSYLMDLMAARARIFGGETFEDYVVRCQELSLLEQGWLAGPRRRSCWSTAATTSRTRSRTSTSAWTMATPRRRACSMAAIWGRGRSCPRSARGSTPS